jgi:uncharacterized lipoprotein YajG
MRITIPMLAISFRKPHRFITGVLIALAFLLAACGKTTTTPSEAPVITDPAPTESQEAVVSTEVVEIDSECLACHIDQQRLIDTAGPEVEIEIESSGEG